MIRIGTRFIPIIIGGFFALFFCAFVQAQTPPSPSASNPTPMLAQIQLNEDERRYLGAKGPIRICVDPDRMPFDGINKQGAHSGLSGDYFQEFARLLDTQMVMHPVKNWDELMHAAKNRDCDVVTQINASQARKKFLDFTTPYFSLPLAVVTRYDRIFVEDSLEGAGNQFTVVKGDIAIKKLTARYPQIELIEVQNNIEGLHKVRDGDVFGYIGAQGAVAFALQSNNLGKLSVTGSLPMSYELSVATRNDEPLLGTAFEKAVQAIDGKEAQRIRNKWIAITVERVTDYTLLHQVLIVSILLLAVSFYWNRRLTKANKIVHTTLSQLHVAQHQLELQNEQLIRQAITDSLTKVYNRFKLDEAITAEIYRTKRSGETFGIVMLDIDHFKRINDTHGHQVGDEVLVTFAEVLKRSARAIDVVGRWGGEEFLILCPGTDEEGCRVMAEKMRTALADQTFPNAQSLSASFGVTQYRQDETAQVVIARADEALYRAKENGRNRVEIS